MRSAILILLIILCISCAKQDNLFIVGGPYIAQYSNGNVAGYTTLEIQSDPILRTAEVKVNGSTVELIEGEPGISHTLLFEENSRPIIGTEYDLTVDTDQGNATATCHVPTAFALIQPLYAIQPDTDISVIWSKPYGGDWYIAYLWYTYIDSFGYFVDIDTTIYCQDTIALAPAQWFTKTHNILGMRIEIPACNGPVAESGSKGNIDGT